LPFRLLHTPPLVASVNVTDEPTHTTEGPSIVLMVGKALIMLITLEVEATPQVDVMV
jgi:hypothetical protein